MYFISSENFSLDTAVALLSREETMAEVAVSFLSAFLGVLFDRIASQEVVDFFKGRKLNHLLLHKLKITLLSVSGLLDDAEEKQITKPAVKMWLDELKDAVYEADDFFDEIAYEAHQSKFGTGFQVLNFFSSHYPFEKGMETRLEEVLGTLEYLAKQKDVLGLKEDTGERPSWQKTPTTSLLDKSSSVYGRDNDMEAIMEMLLANDVNGKDLGMISVLGMAGVGKTTLAQLVYNECRVEEHFDLKAWVCVSEAFDVLKTTKDILEEVTRATYDSKTLNRLQLELKKALTGKKFLLVLDDVWNDNYTEWDLLLRPLKSGVRGSRIVVTTRNESVASVMSTNATHHLKELKEDDCWFLFAEHAFDDGNPGAHQELSSIGREIVRKCRGLPLAAKTLGGLLRSKKDAEEWQKISKSNIWDLPNDNILPALRLSYHHLPSQLKRCFAYCSIFPKGFVFEKHALIPLWMAEGFLSQPAENKEMEEIGEEYFHDLVSRSLFQQLSGYQSCYVMHDLINDLAKFVSGEFCFRMESNNSRKITKRTRHLSYRRTEYNAFDSVYEAETLRTFLPVNLSRWWLPNHIDIKTTNDLLPKLRRLRVLSLSGHFELPDSFGRLKHLRYLNLSAASIVQLPNIVSTLYNLQTLLLCQCIYLVELPDSVGNLKHLRYIDLCETSIKRLPESVSSLYELQTLILYQCEDLIELPTDMKRLVNLCHLDIRGTKLQNMPSKMGELKKLKKLTDFFVGKQSNSCNIRELGKLEHLYGTLCIWNLQDVVHAEDALLADMKGKKHLQALELIWHGDTDDTYHERVILEQLKPHASLKGLLLHGYGGTRFPDWVGDSCFSNIVNLELKGCRYCSSLPPLGQLTSLKELSIIEFDGIVSIGSEFYGICTERKPFRSLERLRFERMPQLREWISSAEDDEGEAFPLLLEFYIRECPNLSRALPISLPSLTILEVEECQQLVSSFPKAPTISRLKLEDSSRDVMLEELPSGMHSLRVDRCDSLGSLLEGMKEMGNLFSTVEEIDIRDCGSLKCFPLELFLKLKSLRITRCPNLESLLAPEASHEDTSSSSSRRLPNLESEGLPAANLMSLRLRDCFTLKSLPAYMRFAFPSLRILEVTNCPALEWFPGEFFPLELQSLCIQNCDKFIACGVQWDLHSFAGLSHFKIGSCRAVESFPEEILLPSTLTSLKIFNLQNLRSLDYRGLQRLTSLRELEIFNCPKLRSIPEEGLPSSLSSLIIYDCPLLKERCQRERGEDWPKIAHISYVEIE